MQSFPVFNRIHGMAGMTEKKTEFCNPRHLLAFLERAYALSREYLPEYSGKYSRKDFTQHQTAACFLLKEYFELDFRLLNRLLRTNMQVRKLLGLGKIPDSATLCRHFRRIPGNKLAVLKKKMAAFLITAHARMRPADKCKPG